MHSQADYTSSTRAETKVTDPASPPDSISVSPGLSAVAKLDSLRVYKLSLLGLVLISLAFRIFAINWGIPDFDPARIATSNYRNSYHIDEDNFIWGPMQMRPAQGNFDVVDYHWGTLQFFLVDGAFLGRRIERGSSSPWETAFQNGDIATIPKLYVLGRLVSVLAGVIGTLLVAALGSLWPDVSEVWPRVPHMRLRPWPWSRHTT